MNILPQIKEAKKSICYRILTPKQVGPICWFMATFVAMFYSQRSRKILLEASKEWDNRKVLFELLKHVLDDKYLKKKDGSDDYKYFSDDTFIKILIYLNIENNNIFPYDPKKVTGGFIPLLYIGKLYKLLNVDYKIFNYYTKDDTLAYSHLNEEYDAMIYTIVKKKIGLDINVTNIIENKNKYVENKYAPPILIVNVNDIEGKHSFNKIKDGDVKDQLKSMREQIFYNGKEYNLDSVILNNWNINKHNGHAIAGITCKKGKYVYNGWTRTSMDPVMAKNITRNIPCELMKYNWNIKNDDFCLNTTKCIPELLRKKLKVRDICFNFSKGSKLLIYVVKDVKVDTSIDSVTMSPTKSPTKSPKKCPEGKVLNLKTGRCILIKNAKTNMSPKKCPEGKVLNPKTGRCILIKNAKTNMSPKKCPEGKVLNPKTGRCILIKNAKKGLSIIKGFQ